MNHRRTLAAAAAAGLAILAPLGLWAQSAATQPSTPAYLKAFPNFAPNVSPVLPGDVDTALKTRLENNKEFDRVQREFDLYSWQMFFALAWPTNDEGRPAPKLTDTKWGAPRWTSWNTSPQIFRINGGTPAACARPGLINAAAVADTATPLFKGLGAFPAQAHAADPRTTRLLGVISAVGDVNVNTPMSDIQQAFSGPLIDQNGEFVYYEILIDKNEVTYLCDNSLYNINGQLAFTAAGKAVDMPTGIDTTNDSGSFELKVAWKVLSAAEDKSGRFFTVDGFIKDEDANNNEITRPVRLGLVGMHIAHKSATSPQWIWSTFEHVDNLSVDPIANPGLKPSFFNPGCELCAVNVLPVAGPDGVYPRTPTQAWRSVPIPDAKVALNDQVRAAMAKQGSVWQYYQLIDTQWPTDPSAKATDSKGPLPNSIANKPGGDPTPVFLTNITMETYFQGGNSPACGIGGGAGCTVYFTGHPVAPTDNGATVFASESCMGCHFSAGVYSAYNPKTGQGVAKSGTGDFSWLLSKKAQWKP
ncbi:hypothetical protein [Caulobacter sp. NIBR1757]|uniref:hypothetical protein n=1 Tax=Caulobacter sp. NIBR1757 TaxID=3016000 RepID=UPI0022F00195|nr:hypothetical protein [Caulobacter sp. NIBR1757]WGM38587.1 hypothetical protein AMEJIAPC_01490 [Caulobacter sp. NIBR1757]